MSFVDRNSREGRQCPGRFPDPRGTSLHMACKITIKDGHGARRQIRMGEIACQLNRSDGRGETVRQPSKAISNVGLEGARDETNPRKD